MCGLPFYISETEVTFKDGTTYKPYCFWLDLDDSYGKELKEGQPWLAADGHKPVGVNFHIKDFIVNNETVQAYNNDLDLICEASARMQGHPKKPDTIAIYRLPLEYGYQISPMHNITGDAHTPARNNFDCNTKDRPGVTWAQSDSRRPYDGWRYPYDHRVGPRPSWMPPDKATYKKPKKRQHLPDFSEDLVYTYSADPGNSAETACAIKTMAGPSFVNMHESEFCRLDKDMAKRKVLPICKRTVRTDCFNVETNQVMCSLERVPFRFRMATQPPVLKTHRNIKHFKDRDV
jgi:hypothetical protein